MSAEKAAAFRALHKAGDPIVLFNIWDAGSARIVAGAGARAVGTGSWSVAAAQGFEDGERLPLELAVANIRRIVEAVELPVTIDLEGGYGREAERVAASARQALAAGAVGCNLEDRIVGGTGLYEVEEQCRRLAGAREAAPAGRFFINARIDTFLQAEPRFHEGLIDEALERGRAYAQVGADGLFVPGLVADELIGRFCEASPLPVNIMVWQGTPALPRLAELGAARISHAGAPWRVAMEALRCAAEDVYGRAAGSVSSG
jgi:2-methylisocitrate lyase-like PEP mutase family enzyme